MTSVLFGAEMGVPLGRTGSDRAVTLLVAESISVAVGPEWPWLRYGRKDYDQPHGGLHNMEERKGTGYRLNVWDDEVAREAQFTEEQSRYNKGLTEDKKRTEDKHWPMKATLAVVGYVVTEYKWLAE
jgi:hypothetical protein